MVVLLQDLVPGPVHLLGQVLDQFLDILNLLLCHSLDILLNITLQCLHLLPPPLLHQLHQ